MTKRRFFRLRNAVVLLGLVLASPAYGERSGRIAGLYNWAGSGHAGRRSERSERDQGQPLHLIFLPGVVRRLQNITWA